MSTDYIIITNTPEETKDLGERLGRLLKDGDIVCLYGELGAGKTTFVQGIAKGLDIKEGFVASPTFVIVNEYKGRLPLYHIDLYRLNSLSEIEDIGILEYLKGKGVTVIEWAEKAEEILPEERLTIYLENPGGGKRKISFKGKGNRFTEILNGLKEHAEHKH